MRVIIEKKDFNEYGYRFRVTQCKHMGPLVEQICELTEYEPDLEGWSYRKKGCKSYDITIRRLTWVISCLLYGRLGVHIEYLTSSMVKD